MFFSPTTTVRKNASSEYNYGRIDWNIYQEKLRVRTFDRRILFVIVERAIIFLGAFNSRRVRSAPFVFFCSIGKKIVIRKPLVTIFLMTGSARGQSSVRVLVICGVSGGWSSLDDDDAVAIDAARLSETSTLGDR